MTERARVIGELTRIYCWPELMKRSGELLWLAGECKSRVLSAAARLLKDAADKSERFNVESIVSRAEES